MISLGKGTVASVDGSTATVSSLEHPGIVTRPLVIPYYWRELMGFIKPGDTVYYIDDSAHGGMIIARADGNWDQTIRGTLTVEQAVTLQNTLSVASNATFSATVTATGNITGAGVSLQTHTHTSTVAGTPTSQPIA